MKEAVTEIRSHAELKGIELASIRIYHNTMSAPHADNSLVGSFQCN
jgi:hypothetical protein